MAGFHAQGCTITLDGSISLGGVVSIQPGNQTRGEVDVTDADSGYDMEFVPGLRDAGNCTIECRHIPDDEGQLALLAQYATNDGSLIAVLITLPSSAVPGSTATIAFNAFVNRAGDINLPQATNDAASRTFGLRISGAITEAVV